MAITSADKENIFNDVIDSYRLYGLYVTSAQNNVRWYDLPGQTFSVPVSSSPLGTSGRYSPLDVITIGVIEGITNFYSTSAITISGISAIGLTVEDPLSSVGGNIGLKYSNNLRINSLGQIDTIQNLQTSSTPTFSTLNLTNLTNGQIVIVSAGRLITSALSVGDHGSLNGLGDDDHVQYIIINPTTNERNVISVSNVVLMTLRKGSEHTTNIFQIQENDSTNILVVTSAGTLITSGSVIVEDGLNISGTLKIGALSGIISAAAGILTTIPIIPISVGGTNNSSFSGAQFIWYNGSQLVSSPFSSGSFLVSANGTINNHSKFVGPNQIGNSIVSDDGIDVTIDGGLIIQDLIGIGERYVTVASDGSLRTVSASLGSVSGSGSGTIDRLSKFITSATIGDSIAQEIGSLIRVNGDLEVYGTISDEPTLYARTSDDPVSKNQTGGILDLTLGSRHSQIKVIALTDISAVGVSGTESWSAFPKTGLSFHATDPGLGIVEVARMTYDKKFILGKITDNGRSLQIVGDGDFSGGLYVSGSDSYFHGNISVKDLNVSTSAVAYRVVIPVGGIWRNDGNASLHVTSGSGLVIQGRVGTGTNWVLTNNSALGQSVIDNPVGTLIARFYGNVMTPYMVSGSHVQTNTLNVSGSTSLASTAGNRILVTNSSNQVISQSELFWNSTTPGITLNGTLNVSGLSNLNVINCTTLVVNNSASIIGLTYAKGNLRVGTGDVDIQAGDTIGKINFYSEDASTGASGDRGRIEVVNDFAGNWDGTSSRWDTNMGFYVAVDGTETLALRLNSNLSVFVPGTMIVSGHTNLNGTLNVSGSARFSSPLSYYSGISGVGDIYLGLTGNRILATTAGGRVATYSELFWNSVTPGITLNGTLNVSGSTSLASDLIFAAGRDIIIQDNHAAALTINQGGNAYLRFITTDSAESITAFRHFLMTSTLNVSGNTNLAGNLITSLASAFPRTMVGKSNLKMVLGDSDEWTGMEFNINSGFFVFEHNNTSAIAIGSSDVRIVPNTVVGTGNPTFTSKRFTVIGNSFDSTTVQFENTDVSGVDVGRVFNFGITDNASNDGYFALTQPGLRTVLAVFKTGNISFGTVVDAGFKFEVSGTSRFDSNVFMLNGLNVSGTTTLHPLIGTGTRFLGVNSSGQLTVVGNVSADVSGSLNRIPKFNTPISLGDSIMFQNSTIVMVEGNLSASGNVSAASLMLTNTNSVIRTNANSKRVLITGGTLDSALGGAYAYFFGNDYVGANPGSLLIGTPSLGSIYASTNDTVRFYITSAGSSIFNGSLNVSGFANFNDSLNLGGGTYSNPRGFQRHLRLYGASNSAFQTFGGAVEATFTSDDSLVIPVYIGTNSGHAISFRTNNTIRSYITSAGFHNFVTGVSAFNGVSVPDGQGLTTEIGGSTRDLVARSGTTLLVGENGGWTDALYRVESGSHSFIVGGSIRATANVDGFSVAGDLDVTGGITVDENLIVDGALNVSGTLSFSNYITTTSTLVSAYYNAEQKLSDLTKPFLLFKSVTNTQYYNFGPSLCFVEPRVYINDDLTVSGDIRIGDDLFVVDDMTVSGDVSIVGQTSFHNNLIIDNGFSILYQGGPSLAYYDGTFSTILGNTSTRLELRAWDAVGGVRVPGVLSATNLFGGSLNLSGAGNLNGLVTFNNSRMNFSNTDFIFGANTSDGSDNKRLILCGGGDQSNSRGGIIYIHGNDYLGIPGSVSIRAGENGYVSFATGFSNEPLRITSAGNFGFPHDGAIDVYGQGIGVFSFADCTTAPISARGISGFIMYSEGGAAKVMGGSGTITTFGPAHPHCPQCGMDFMTEHENKKYGYLAVCLNCLSNELGDKPWILRKRNH